MSKMTTEDLKKTFQKVFQQDHEKMKGISSFDFTFYSRVDNGIIVNNGNGFGTGYGFYNRQKGLIKKLENITVPQVQNPPSCDIFIEGDVLKPYYHKSKKEEGEEDKNLDGDPLRKTTSSISSECFKKTMYSDYSFGLNNCKDIIVLLTNPKTLINGFVNTDKGAIYRSGATYFSDLNSSFLLKEDVSDLAKWQNILGQELTKEHFKENGLLKLENHTTTGAKEGTSLYSKLTHRLSQVFYKGCGSLNLEQLQFIPVCGELGRDSLGETKLEEHHKIKEMLEFRLNLTKTSLLKELENNQKYYSFKILRDLKSLIEKEESEIVVDYGKFRKLGSITQKMDSNLLETGFLLNDVAMAVLTLLFFNLLLKTNIKNKEAELNVISLQIEAINTSEDFKLTTFYEKVE